jgi:hypothetical protein
MHWRSPSRQKSSRSGLVAATDLDGRRPGHFRPFEQRAEILPEADIRSHFALPASLDRRLDLSRRQ